MKKMLITATIVLLISTVIYSQRYYIFKILPNESYKNYIYNDDGNMANKDTQELFSGRLKTSYNKDSYDIYSYKNGVLNGPNAAYKNGKLKEVGYWKNGLQDGLFLLYNENGILVDYASFKDGNRHGTTKQYYEDGTLRIEAIYENSILEGKATEYYPNGKIRISGSMNNGEFIPQSIHMFDENGNEVSPTPTALPNDKNNDTIQIKSLSIDETNED